MPALVRVQSGGLSPPVELHSGRLDFSSLDRHREGHASIDLLGDVGLVELPPPAACHLTGDGGGDVAVEVGERPVPQALLPCATGR